MTCFPVFYFDTVITIEEIQNDLIIFNSWRWVYIIIMQNWFIYSHSNKTIPENIAVMSTSFLIHICNLLELQIIVFQITVNNKVSY